MVKESFSDQLRQLIEASGMSRVAICKHIGIDQATMSRFMHRKGGLSMDGLDRLGELLGLKITAEPRAADKGD